MPHDKWTAVASAINARLKDLGWGQADLVRKSGVNDLTIRNLQKAKQESYRATTLARVSRALGWPADGIEGIAEGRDRVNEDGTVDFVPRGAVARVDVEGSVPVRDVLRNLDADQRSDVEDAVASVGRDNPEVEIEVRGRDGEVYRLQVRLLPPPARQQVREQLDDLLNEP